MAKHILIDRGNGFSTLVRSEIETASEDPLTDNEILINELYNKVKNIGVLDDVSDSETWLCMDVGKGKTRCDNQCVFCGDY